MGLFLGRRQRERRDSGGAPAFGLSGPRIALSQTSYADIDASRIDTALQSVAVAVVVDLIASLASELPIVGYRDRDSTTRQKIKLPSYFDDLGGDGYGTEDWCYRVLMSLLLRGNLYGEVLDRRATYLTQVEIFNPDKVGGHMEGGRPVWTVNGTPVENPDRFLHRRAYPLPGQIQGRSPIAYHASTTGVSLASTQFGAQWFKDGAHPTGIMRNTEVELDYGPGGNARTAKDIFLAALRGVREPLVLGKGWEYQQIQINPEESQFLETMGYSAAECARMYGPGLAELLGYAVKGTSLTYGNLQDRDLHVLKYATNKWFRRLERLLSAFLPRPQFVVLDRDALLETNTLARYQAHASALQERWKVVNEIRLAEGLPPVPWGNEPNSGSVAPAVEPEPEPVDEEPPSDEDEEEDEDTP